MKIKLGKKLYLIPLFILLLIILLIVAGIVWFNKNSKAVTDVYSKQRFVVTNGMSATQVGTRLKESGLIRSAFAFKVYTQVFGKAKKINAGEFGISASMDLAEIVAALGKGPEELWVTIPEGLRREEVVEKIIPALEMDDAQASSFRKNFLDLTSGKEGYLYPDTYLFPRDAFVQVVVNKLVNTFNQKVDDKMKGNIAASGKSINEIIIMASLIERETKTSEERPIVAGILWKRLGAKWPLQVDASLQYAVANLKLKTLPAQAGQNSKLNNYWEPLTKDDLEVNSPYNTYMFTGLPPMPICNPGLSSISAAIYPQDSDYWFYLHDAEGNIHYAKTIEEHNLNVSKYLGK
jgi:UPF0755 protein